MSCSVGQRRGKEESVSSSNKAIKLLKAFGKMKIKTLHHDFGYRWTIIVKRAFNYFSTASVGATVTFDPTSCKRSKNK